MLFKFSQVLRVRNADPKPDPKQLLQPREVAYALIIMYTCDDKSLIATFTFFILLVLQQYGNGIVFS